MILKFHSRIMVLNILLNNLKIYLLWSFYFVTDDIAKKVTNVRSNFLVVEM